MREKKQKIVAYCRISTLEQKKGYGIDIQIRDVTIYGERHDFLVERFYKDEGESGAKEDRKELRRLMKDCRKGRIGIVILPSLDRLSREVRIAENLFYEFKRLGIKVLIADMPQYNGERKDILIRQIMEAVAEENRREIIERLWKGRQERVRKGFFSGGNIPYGYIRERGNIIINIKEAEVVRKIYALAGVLRTGCAIAHDLNRQGILRRNGRPWTQRQVAKILERGRLYREGIVQYGTVRGCSPNLALWDK
jgi:DNA invertase Pin-like site-specific DNA recombinase